MFKYIYACVYQYEILNISALHCDSASCWPHIRLKIYIYKTYIYIRVICSYNDSQCLFTERDRALYRRFSNVTINHRPRSFRMTILYAPIPSTSESNDRARFATGLIKSRIPNNAHDSFTYFFPSPKREDKIKKNA